MTGALLFANLVTLQLLPLQGNHTSEFTTIVSFVTPVKYALLPCDPLILLQGGWFTLIDKHVPVGCLKWFIGPDVLKNKREHGGRSQVERFMPEYGKNIDKKVKGNTESTYWQLCY